MKILFLKIEGVLRHQAWKEMRVRQDYDTEDLLNADRIACSNVQYVLDHEPDCHIVLTDFARKVYEPEEIKEFFSEWRVDAERVIGQTPDLSGDKKIMDPEIERWKEIQAWLAEHPAVDEFVIVDDAESMGPYKSRFIQVDPTDGFILSDAKDALKVLAGHIVRTVSLEPVPANQVQYNLNVSLRVDGVLDYDELIRKIASVLAQGGEPEPRLSGQVEPLKTGEYSVKGHVFLQWHEKEMARVAQ